MQRTCSRCGGLLAPGATACSYCGQPVADAYAQQNYPAPTQYGAYPPTAATSDPYAAQYGTQAAPPPLPTAVSGPPYGQPAYGAPAQPSPFGPGSQPPSFQMPPQPPPKKSSAPLIGVILAIIVVLAGLGVGGYFLFAKGSPGPVVNATPTVGPLYQANLTSDPGGWACNSTCSFRADGYHIESPDNSVYPSYMTRQVIDNAVLEVKGIIAKGDPNNAEIDVIFRLQQSATLAGYLFRIFPDGTYGVSRSAPSGDFTTLLDTTPATSLKKGLNQENTFKVVFTGSQFTLYINGEQVNQITDTNYTKGYIGLGAGGKNTEGIFSNLTVTKP
ncbi:MAG TPA: family 16 glycoside hydrolase [Ktedonobacterales bacterium]|nr:family 16 glycoside hydrolase [Ktedonobacterales bacterium]